MLGLFRETEPIGYFLVFINIPVVYMGLPWWFNSTNPSASAGDVGSILGSGRSPGEGNGNPFHYSCLRILGTGELGRLQSMGLHKSQTWLTEQQQTTK